MYVNAYFEALGAYSTFRLPNEYVEQYAHLYDVDGHVEVVVEPSGRLYFC